jgi:hypothetical protein
MKLARLHDAVEAIHHPFQHPRPVDLAVREIVPQDTEWPARTEVAPQAGTTSLTVACPQR